LGLTAAPDRERVNQEWIMDELIRIIRCQKGANAIEYALVASLIAIAAVAAMQKLGNGVDSMFNNVSNLL
jgi:pilus assembly protein Flp/PilA